MCIVIELQFVDYPSLPDPKWPDPTIGIPNSIFLHTKVEKKDMIKKKKGNIDKWYTQK